MTGLRQASIVAPLRSSLPICNQTCMRNLTDGPTSMLNHKHGLFGISHPAMAFSALIQHAETDYLSASWEVAFLCSCVWTLPVTQSGAALRLLSSGPVLFLSGFQEYAFWYFNF